MNKKTNMVVMDMEILAKASVCFLMARIGDALEENMSLDSNWKIKIVNKRIVR